MLLPPGGKSLPYLRPTFEHLEQSKLVPHPVSRGELHRNPNGLKVLYLYCIRRLLSNNSVNNSEVFYSKCFSPSAAEWMIVPKSAPRPPRRDSGKTKIQIPCPCYLPGVDRDLSPEPHDTVGGPRPGTSRRILDREYTARTQNGWLRTL